MRQVDRMKQNARRMEARTTYTLSPRSVERLYDIESRGLVRYTRCLQQHSA